MSAGKIVATRRAAALLRRFGHGVKAGKRVHRIPGARLNAEPKEVRDAIKAALERMPLTTDGNQAVQAPVDADDVRTLLAKVLDRLEVLDAIKATPKAVSRLSGKVTKMGNQVAQLSADVRELKERWAELEAKGEDLVNELKGQ